MKKAFTLVEILIVVAILGILAAIALPQFQSHVQEAKEAAAKDNLRILRQQIELYAAQNKGVPPGYPGNNTSIPPVANAFILFMLRNDKYLSAMPENPFNNKATLQMIANDVIFPAEPTGEYGWVYQPQSKTIKLDWTGTDKDGTSYYDY
ncbi:MAG: type IV pilin protein [Planctomycetota bacterium]|jgi:prepilin-type N-terminal cleavage/methylation domain-containing protein